MRRNWHKKLFAWLLNKGETFDKKLAPFKKQLFSDFTGKKILEIGAGAGLNLKYYRDAEVIYLLEPNQHAHPYILQRNKIYKLNIQIIKDFAEAIPLPDNSVDAVISTFVLCSVESISKTLKEAARVLKPEGHFLFLEHVMAERGVTEVLQKIFRAPWKCIADGCDCCRDTQSLIKKSGIFSKVDSEIICKVPSVFLSPWLLGMAQKDN